MLSICPRNDNELDQADYAKKIDESVVTGISSIVWPPFADVCTFLKLFFLSNFKI
jgi:hypothetical protein